MKKSNRQKWSGEQKAAVAAELETHIGELLQQSIRLNQEAQDKLKLVGELVERLAWRHAQEEEDLPF